MVALDDKDHGVVGFGSYAIHLVPLIKPKKAQKKKNPLSLVLGSQLWQVQKPINMVLSMGPGPSCSSWLALLEEMYSVG